ncbi:hypothetical protein [Micromonospora coerulea]|uniref:hypothetical protein n=1 Tax=Micromonospora coerulea TaxID=47856 RepID=UPI0027DBAC68|nr:hypothetical protein [Micromonospora veneta]
MAAFRGLRRLRVVAHRRGLADLLAANPGLQGLALWRLSVDRVVSDVVLPRLQSLALTLGSLKAAEWLTPIPSLRYLALRTVRKLTDLAVVTRLPALQWLWLDALPVDRLGQHLQDLAKQQVQKGRGHGLHRVGHAGGEHVPNRRSADVTQFSSPTSSGS